MAPPVGLPNDPDIVWASRLPQRGVTISINPILIFGSDKRGLYKSPISVNKALIWKMSDPSLVGAVVGRAPLLSQLTLELLEAIRELFVVLLLICRRRLKPLKYLIASSQLQPRSFHLNQITLDCWVRLRPGTPRAVLSVLQTLPRFRAQPFRHRALPSSWVRE
jgi:hypothetical protein